MNNIVQQPQENIINLEAKYHLANSEQVKILRENKISLQWAIRISFFTLNSGAFASLFVIFERTTFGLNSFLVSVFFVSFSRHLCIIIDFPFGVTLAISGLVLVFILVTLMVSEVQLIGSRVD
jgi:hypothetical protein